MPRKITLSFLGTGAYRTTDYFFPGEFESETYTTPLIQVAIQDYAKKHLGFRSSDLHILLLTEDARTRNYLAAAKPFDGPAEHTGLKHELDKLTIPTPTKDVNVDTGHDRDSIVKTFDRMVAEVQEGDEVYLDVTHGFRSLPMLALVLANFLRVAKGAEVKAIFYGAFEDKGKNNDRAPVYDLSYLLEIQEWTTATYGYINYGFAGPLEVLSKAQISPVLRESAGKDISAQNLNSLIKGACDFEQLLRTNRGHEISTGEVASNIQKLAKQLTGDSKLEKGPLPILVNRIAEKTSRLATHDGLNWLRAARLAYDDGLLQQACSLLREGIVTYVCRIGDLNPGLEKDRSLVETALNAVGAKIPEHKWTIPTDRDDDFHKIVTLNVVELIRKPFYSLSPFRNDLMHAGYYTDEEPKKNARSAKRITGGIVNALKIVEEALLLKD